MAAPKVEQNPAGDYAVGVEVDGVFIPIATVAASRIQHLTERHADLTEKAKGGDKAAQDVLDAEYGAKPKSEEK